MKATLRPRSPCGGVAETAEDAAAVSVILSLSMAPHRASLLALGLAISIAACGTTHGGSDGAAGSRGYGPWDEGVHIPDEAPVPGDVEAGFEALVSNGYISCGIPLSVFPLAQAVLGPIAQSPPLTDSDGAPLRSGKNADIPYNWNVHTRDGVDLVSPNCLQCHAEKIHDELSLSEEIIAE